MIFEQINFEKKKEIACNFLNKWYNHYKNEKINYSQENYCKLWIISPIFDSTINYNYFIEIYNKSNPDLQCYNLFKNRIYIRNERCIHRFYDFEKETWVTEDWSKNWVDTLKNEKITERINNWYQISDEYLPEITM